MSDKAHEIYMKVSKEFDRVLYEHLKKEDEETRDYVEQMLLDEYRPWNYMLFRRFEHDKSDT